MAKHPSRRDANEDAADVVRRSTAEPDELSEPLKAAWARWARRIKKCDERTMTLLRAAFEAGAAAAKKHSSPASELGRLGASKGGAARAAKLSKKRRADIAQRAAEARWGRRRDPE